MAVLLFIATACGNQSSAEGGEIFNMVPKRIPILKLWDRL